MGRFRHPARRTVEQVQAAIRATVQRIGQLEAMGHDAGNYRRELPFLRAELARAEKRARVVA